MEEVVSRVFVGSHRKCCPLPPVVHCTKMTTSYVLAPMGMVFATEVITMLKRMTNLSL